MTLNYIFYKPGITIGRKPPEFTLLRPNKSPLLIGENALDRILISNRN